MLRSLIEGLRALSENHEKISWELVNVPLDDLINSFGFKFDKKNNKKLDYLGKRLKNGSKFPPVLVVKLKKGYQVLDGHHRIAALKLSGQKKAPTLLGTVEC